MATPGTFHGPARDYRSLVYLLTDFHAQYPAARCDVDLIIAARDLVAEGFDLAIRMAGTLNPSLLARQLGVARETMLASTAYQAAHAPDDAKEPNGLSRLEALRNRSFRDKGRWLLQRGKETIAVPG